MVKSLTGFMLKPVYYKVQLCDFMEIIINELPERLSINTKLFSDDTSLFSIVRNITAIPKNSIITRLIQPSEPINLKWYLTLI